MIPHYKEISDYPNYFINDTGTSVLKLCCRDRHVVIDGVPHVRKSTITAWSQLDPDIYIAIGNNVFRKIKLTENRFGYLLVTLRNEHRTYTAMLHRIMYSTFVGPIPEGMEIHHIDHNKKNNLISNLEAVTHKENIARSMEFYGIKPKRPCATCGTRIDGRSEIWNQCTTCDPPRRDPVTGKKVLTPKEIASNQQRRKVPNRPAKEALLTLITTTPFATIGKQYGVSDNAVRKWCRAYGLPHRTKDIKELMNNK